MLVINDALDIIFLGTFFFGLVFSALSLVFGAADAGFDHGHGGHHGHHGNHGADADGGISPVNVSTVLAFLAWFGGVGYLARHGLGWYGAVSVIVGVGGGLAGAAAIFWVLARFVRPMDGELRADDYRLPGTIAQVTSSIRAGGTGEILYQQGGVRQVAAARSVNGAPIPRGVEVVVLRLERGIAYVEAWDTLMDDHARPLAEVGERAPAPSQPGPMASS
jgi:hypothetical protein